MRGVTRFLIGCFFVCLLSLAVCAPASFAQGPLNFGDNSFVTGDYVVAGAYGMTTHFSNGYAVGTFSIPDPNPGIDANTLVPPGAEVVAAILYWQTVENAGTTPGQPGTGENGYFRPLIAGGPAAPGYPITGVPLGSNNAVTWSEGGCAAPQAGKITRTYRANVLGSLPQDAKGNVLPNGEFEIRLPSLGPQTPYTLGATLVIIYRVLSPNVPLNSIVIYDGAFGQTTSALNMTQTVQGFYDAATKPVSKLTLIAAHGQSNKFETVYLDNVALPSNAGRNLPPFPGYYGLWDNPTWSLPDADSPKIGNPVPAGAASATAEVVPSANGPACLSWGAVIFSTTVQNSDNDGLLDAWKTSNPPGYCDASINGGKCTEGSTTDPGWVALPGALHGEKDLFIQVDYMCSQTTGIDSCTTGDGTNYSFDPRAPGSVAWSSGAVGLVTQAFLNNSHGIHVHINPPGTSQSVHAIQEQTCLDALPLLCGFPKQAGVVAWKVGYANYKNQLVETNCVGVNCFGPGPAGNESVANCIVTPPAVPPAGCQPRFQHGRKDSWHYALFAHAVGRPEWRIQDGTLTSVVQSGNTVTFTTSTPLNTLVFSAFNDAGYDNHSNPLLDPSCPTYGRVSIFFAATNSNLNGTYCIHALPGGFAGNTFTILVPGPSENAHYTLLTDPGLSVAPGQTGSASGVSDVGGADSLITLGLWGDPTLDGQGVTAPQPISYGQQENTIAGTFMHELGHSLGLTHGGFYYDYDPQLTGIYIPTIEPNCKPNFQSVMNYFLQVDWPTNGPFPDYSEQQLDSINEAKLPSGVTFHGGLPLYPNTSYYTSIPPLAGTIKTLHCNGTPTAAGDPPQTWLVADQPVDPIPTWVNNPGVPQDVDFDGVGVPADYDVLRGYSDWVPGVNGITTGIDLRQIGETGDGTVVSQSNFFGGGQPYGGGGQPYGGGGQPYGGGGQSYGGGGEIDVKTANSYTRPPSGLVASEGASPRWITLTWDPPTFSQIGTYNIYRKPAPNTPNGYGVIATVSANPPASTYTYVDKMDPCNSNGYQYFVTAVLANSNPPQESVPSNVVASIPPSQSPLTGCYTLGAISVASSGVQGTVVPIAWSFTDDFYTTGTVAQNLQANTLVAIGPGGTQTTLLSKGNPTAGDGTFGISNNQFTFNWNSDPFPAGTYTFQLTLDSGQTETSSALQLSIDVNDTNNPHVSTTSLPGGTVAVHYTAAPTEDGGTAPLTWSFSGLPAGIANYPVGSAALTGTVCTAGAYNNIGVMVTDSKNNSGTGTLTLAIAKGSSSTSVVSNLAPNPAVYGQSINLTVSTLSSPLSTCIPAGNGNVTLFSDGVSIASGSLIGGTVTFTTTLPVDTAAQAAGHAITATYSGDSNFNNSATGNPALMQIVNKASTTTTLSSSLNPSIFGQSVTFTATVMPVAPGAGTPTGMVNFYADGNQNSPIGSSPINGVTATLTTSALTAGPHNITAMYVGDNNFLGSSTLTATSQTVNMADTATAVTLSSNSTTLGDVVTLTATLSDSTPMSTGTPTGLVTFFDNGTPIGTGTLNAGAPDQATFTTSLLSYAASPHTITAGYEGDANFKATGTGSSTLTQSGAETVSQRATTVGVGLSPSTVATGNASTTTVTVTDNGLTNPSGTADTWTATGAPGAGASGATATLFADGAVLLAGGRSPSGVVANAYIYNATNKTFTATGNLNTARIAATATLLPNGQILIAGGSTDGTATNALQTAELFNPLTGAFTLAGSGSSGQMAAARFLHTATPLQNGQVLIAGGENSSGSLQTAELYNPATDTFTATGSLSTPRYGAAAAILGNGSVLIAGGQNSGGVLSTAELYAGTFTATGSLNTARTGATATLLLSGNVLIAAGENSSGALSSAELYTAGAFTPSKSSLNTARFNHSAILLPSGMVLLVGGASGNTAELYDPDGDQFEATGNLAVAAGDQPVLTATLLNQGNVLITGLTLAEPPAADAEVYTPSFDPLGTVGLMSSDGSDAFGPACVLMINGSGLSSCNTTVTPQEVGTSPHTITGTYPADAVHSGDSGNAPLAVTTPPQP